MHAQLSSGFGGRRLCLTLPLLPYLCACVKQRLWLDCIMPMLAWAIAARWCDVYQNHFVAGPLVFVAWLPYFIHAKCKDTGKTVQMLRLVWAIAAHQCDKWPESLVLTHFVPYFVSARREGSGGAARMLRLVRAIAARQWDKYTRNLLCWPTCVVSSVSLSLSHWYPGSGVVLDCIDSWSLHHYLLFLNTATHPNRPVFSVCWM